MSSNVCNEQRVAAWNVEFLSIPANPFAGLYQAGDMLTYRDAFGELRLCFGLDEHEALTLWRLTQHEGDTFDDVCIPATPTSPDILDRAIHLQTSSTKTQYMLLNHYTERCARRGMLDVGDHITGRHRDFLRTSLKFKY